MDTIMETLALNLKPSGGVLCSPARHRATLGEPDETWHAIAERIKACEVDGTGRMGDMGSGGCGKDMVDAGPFAEQVLMAYDRIGTLRVGGHEEVVSALRKDYAVIKRDRKTPWPEFAARLMTGSSFAPTDLDVLHDITGISATYFDPMEGLQVTPDLIGKPFDTPTLQLNGHARRLGDVCGDAMAAARDGIPPHLNTPKRRVLWTARLYACDLGGTIKLIAQRTAARRAEYEAWKLSVNDTSPANVVKTIWSRPPLPAD